MTATLSRTPSQVSRAKCSRIGCCTAEIRERVQSSSSGPELTTMDTQARHAPWTHHNRPVMAVRVKGSAEQEVMSFYTKVH